MKVFISADIEGIGGVATWDQAVTKRPDHERARQWMTEEVNTAVEGALEGGATEIIVRDAHGSARNILWDSLHPQARLISGWGPNTDMLLGLDESFGVAFLIGYHPGASAKRGVLSHAFTSRILDLRLNDLPCNEAVVGALEAGVVGVPIGLVSGQAELWDEIRHSLPQCTFAMTKRGYFYQAALLEPLAEVRTRIRNGAREAVAHAIAGTGPAPFRPEPPLRLAMELSTVEAAAAIEGMDGVERVSAGGCLLVDEDAGSLMRRLLTVLKILYGVRDSA
jgi:D-amino peptidase